MNETQTNHTKQIFIFILQATTLVALFCCVWFLTKEKEYKKINVTAVAQNLISLMPDTVVPESDMVLKERFGLEANSYDCVVYYGPDSNMDAAEFLLIDMKDKSQKTEIRNAIKSRLEYQRSCFEGYGVDQMELINSAKTVVYGEYVLFIVSKDSKNSREAFSSAVTP